MKNTIKTITFFSLLCLIALGSFNGFAQNDSIPEVETEKVKKEKKKKDEFKVLAGVTFNSMSASLSEEYDSSSGVGYIIGAKYKRGRFFYWELGARYNAAIYPRLNDSTEDDLKIGNIDVPINVGINLLSVAERLVGLRLFLGAVPTFVISDNLKDTSDEKLNSFMMYGQGGVGVDIAFFFLEAGVNYGFTDLIENLDSSNPTQLFVNLGFRF